MANNNPSVQVKKPEVVCKHEFVPFLCAFGIYDNVITLEGEQDELLFQTGIPPTHSNGCLVTHVRCVKCGYTQKLVELQNGNTRFVF